MKRPSFQFYPADWLKDPRLSMCGPTTRGIWMDLICGMHENDQSGELIGRADQLCRIGRCNEAEMMAALTELSTTQTADISVLDPDGSFRDIFRTCPDLSQKCPDVFRVRNRRMYSAQKERENDRLRKSRQRQHEVSHGKLPKKSRSLSSSSSSSSDKAPNGAGARQRGAAPSKRADCPYQKIIDLYHEMLPELPRVQIVSDARKRAMRARWSNEAPDMEDWRVLFDRVTRSPFLLGKINGTDGRAPFVADFDWICKPANFVKIAEGKYIR